jgi:cellulose synthase operon protein C
MEHKEVRRQVANAAQAAVFAGGARPALLFAGGLLAFGLACASTTAADAAPQPGALHSPNRLTSGTADQFLGTVGPDGHTLYFVSNRNATAQLFAKDLTTGAERLVFDDGADISFPRVSPKGDRVLYVSNRDDAGGDVCVRHLSTGVRRCFTGPGTAELQAFWFPDGKSIAVLNRKGLHGDLRLLRMPVGVSTTAGTALVDDNVSGPALSPDGKWLIWLPIRRASKTVGISFAMQATGGLALRRLAGGKVHNLRFELPGVTGFAAFSRDSRWLYFTQYLSDTTFDGRIDGDDHAVLFRARFDGGKSKPVDTSAPQQLTSARHSCQYPQPARATLIMTCSVDGSLDVFSLPLDGAVPAKWNAKKLDQALASSRDHWQRLMLLHHQLLRAQDKTKKRAVLEQLVRLHLHLGEYASAAFFTKKVGANKLGPDASRWSAAVGQLIAFRREARLLNRGELNDRFIKKQRTRLWQLATLGKGAPRNVRTLVQITMMEVHDVIGEEKRALGALAAISLAKLDAPFALHLYADRAVPLLRELGKDKRARTAMLALATHKSLSRADRIAMTEALLRMTTSGRPASERLKIAKRLRKKVEVDSEAAFRLELEAKLLTLRSDNAEAVRKELFQHYRYHREFERRKTLIGATMRAAAKANSGYLMYQFANTWVSMVSRKHAERPLAENLFRQVVLERAYIDWDKRKYGDARGHFYGLTLQVDSLEAHIGFVEMRQREGKHDALKVYAKRFANKPDHAIWRFVQAYVAAASLPQLDAASRAAAIATAEAHAQVASRALSHSSVLHHLRGYLAHQRFLIDGNTTTAAGAHTHYLLALDLAHGNPRVKASTLHALGLLQAAVGNHHLAVDYFNKRLKLPVQRPTTDLSLAMAHARSLFHVGKPRKAILEAERGLTMIENNGLLTRFRPYVLDRVAMYAWATGLFAKALLRYEELVKLASRRGGANELRAALMAGASALGQRDGERANRHFDRVNVLVKTVSDEALGAGAAVWRRSPRVKAADMQLLVDGLRAQALVAQRRLPDAERALARRATALRTRLSGSQVDANLLALAKTLHDHAALKLQQGAPNAAVGFLEEAIQFTEQHAARTGTANHALRVRIALAYAAMHLYGKVSLSRMRTDPSQLLTTVHTAMCKRPNPARSAERFALKTYLAMLTASSAKPQSQTQPAITNPEPEQ